jgi:hypothetical protein
MDSSPWTALPSRFLSRHFGAQINLAKTGRIFSGSLHPSSLCVCRATSRYMVRQNQDDKEYSMARHHPLVEVFGFPTSNFSPEANRHRAKRLCPYNNKVPNCTKDKAKNPLGVCSIYDDSNIAITCPIRFRQDWLIADDAAAFFFEKNVVWTSLTEVRLPDKYGHSAGNVDIVLVAYNEQGRVVDFGALEVQAVYISGNIRNAFEHYMKDPQQHHEMTWEGPYYPRPITYPPQESVWRLS